MVLVTYRDHSSHTLLDSDLWLVTEDPPSFFDIVPPHTTTIRNPEPRKRVGLPPQPTPKLRKRRENVTKRLWEHSSSFFQSFFFSLWIDNLVQLVPDISRKVPEVNGLPIRDEKDLPCDLQTEMSSPGREQSRKGHRIWYGQWGGADGTKDRRSFWRRGCFPRVLKHGAGRSCLRSGDTMVTRQESDGVEISIKRASFFNRQ